MERGTLQNRITVDEFFALAEQGRLKEDVRVELIDGEIIYMLPPSNVHAANESRLLRRLIQAIGERAIVRSGSTLCLDEFNAPQPDIAVMKYREDDYEFKRASASDALLAIEVSNSSLRRDRMLKAPLYARTGIPEYWILNVKARCIEMYRAPSEGVYRDLTVVDKPTPLEIRGLPGVAVDLSGFFSRLQSTTNL